MFLLFLALPVATPSLAADKDSGASVPSGIRQEEARIPFKPESGSEGIGIAGRVIGGFVVVALLALASVYVLKRYFPSLYAHTSLGTQHIQVLEIRRLTPRATLFLVELDGTRMLLAQSGDRIVNLHRLSGDSNKPPDTARSP